ncbi:MAG TPA: tyrosine-type recombinase/integrase [Thermoanaerobaculia bacterium]
MNGRIPGFKYNPRTHSARFSLYVPNTGGRLRRTLTIDAPSRDEALKLWQKFRDEVSVVDPTQPQRAVAPQPAAADGVPTFRVFIAEHLEKICARLAPKTLTTYQTIADSRLVPFFGDKVLVDIHSCDVEDFMALTLKECSPAYVNACVRTFKALLRHAVKRRVIAASPLTEKIKFEEVLLPELELSDAERVALLGAFDDEAAFRADIGARRREAHVVTSEHFKAPRRFGFGLNPASDASHFIFQRFRALKPAFVVALETGLRKSDLLNLRWSQVDLAAGFIRLTMKKTKKWAVVPISQLCREALDECRRRPVVSEFVFVTEEGRQVADITLRRAFLRAKRIAKLTRRFRFHDLRHSAACTLASMGVSLQVIQKILGHTSIKMTERYVRVNDSAVAEARRALDTHNASLGLVMTPAASAGVSA